MRDIKEFKVEDIFFVEGTRPLDAGKLTFKNQGINFVGRTNENNGVQGKIEKQEFPPNKPHTITATVIGNYKYVKYQDDYYYTSQNINKLTPKDEVDKYVMLYLVAHIQQFVSQYDGQQSGYKQPDLKKHKIKLPCNLNGIPEWEKISRYMQEKEEEKHTDIIRFIESLGYYIQEESIFTERDKDILEEHGKAEFKEYAIGSLFDRIQQGSRLKRSDHIKGDLTFVMSGVENKGVVGKIGNKSVPTFPENSLTIDIFGNTFYRNYQFSASDDVGVYWNESNPYDRHELLYLSTAIGKELKQKHEFGNKLRASESYEITVRLPEKDNLPDFELMRNYIRALEKKTIENIISNYLSKY